MNTSGFNGVNNSTEKNKKKKAEQVQNIGSSIGLNVEPLFVLSSGGSWSTPLGLGLPLQLFVITPIASKLLKKVRIFSKHYF